MPPEGVKTSNLNLGRAFSFSSLLRLPIGSEKFVREKLAEADFGEGGQRVISVAWVTEWNFARASGVDDFSAPECRIMSGREVLSGDVGVSFWIVM